MKIGQAATATGISERMIRHYEKVGLIGAAPRRDSGYRDYGEADVRTLQFIRRARDLGFPLEEIRQLLALWHDSGRSSADVKALALARADELQRKMREMELMRTALLHLAELCAGDQRPDCPILGGLAAAEAIHGQ
jgi:MerR family copper efflux transcriptional regulator